MSQGPPTWAKLGGVPRPGEAGRDRPHLPPLGSVPAGALPIPSVRPRGRRPRPAARASPRQAPATAGGVSMGPSPGIQAGGAFIPGQVAFKTVTRKPGRGGGSRAGEAVAGWGGRGRSGHRPFLLRPRAVPPRPPAPPPGAGRAGPAGRGMGQGPRGFSTPAELEVPAATLSGGQECTARMRKVSTD